MTVSPGGRPADDSPLGHGKNWVTKRGGLPGYIREVAHALIRDGHTESEAIQMAIASMHRFAATSKKPAVRAAAVKALAQWEAMKGTNLSMTPAREADFARETDKIRANRATPAAQVPHSFKAASWTHPNGHPRCLLCGAEERTGGCEGAAKDGGTITKPGARNAVRYDLANEEHRYRHGWIPISPSSVSAVLKKAGHVPVPRYREGVSVSKSYEPTTVWVHSMILDSSRHEKDLADHAHQALEAAGYEVERTDDRSMRVRKPAKTDLSNIAPAKVHDKLAEHYPKSTLGWVKTASWDKRTVPLGVVSVKPRPGKPHDAAKVAGIRRAIRSGKKLGRVMLVDTGDGAMKIADGYHRTRALRLEGHTMVRALVATKTAPAGPWDRKMHDSKLNT